MYLLNNLEIPIVTLNQERMRNLKKPLTYIGFTLLDVYNENNVKSIAINRRNCRFSDEVKEDSFYDSYDSDLCVLEASTSKAFKNI